MRRELLKGIKGYRTANFSIETIAEVVPSLIADFFKTFMATNMQGNASPIGYDWGRLLEFQINLGTMIKTKQFDYLDNVVIQFLKSYSHVHSAYRFFIKFSDAAIEKFTKICNSFKGLDWDDIVDEFVDALYEFFSQGKMANNKLIE